MARNNFTRGLVTGAMLGATISMMFNPMEKRERKMLRRKTKRVMGTVGNIIDDIMDLRK